VHRDSSASVEVTGDRPSHGNCLPLLVGRPAAMMALQPALGLDFPYGSPQLKSGLYHASNGHFIDPQIMTTPDLVPEAFALRNVFLRRNYRIAGETH
jgi:hypothetical protein